MPLDIDPNLVRAGWLPLALVALIGLIIVGLWFSMRHEIRKISAPRQSELGGDDADAARPGA